MELERWMVALKDLGRKQVLAKMESINILDYWTEVALMAHWRELVEEAKEVNFTGATQPQDLSTGPT